MAKLLSRLGLALGAALFVLVGLLLALLPSRGEERTHSVFSAEKDGLRALYLTLEMLGFPVAAWSEAPGELAHMRGVLVLTQPPEAPPALPGALAPAGDGPASPLRRSRDLAHYRRFVEAGGTLLVCLDAMAETLEFLSTTLGWSELADVESVWIGRDASRVAWFGAERVDLGEGFGRGLRASAPGEVLARTEDGSTLVLARALGRGRVVLATLPAARLDNEELGADGAAAQFLVRTLEALAPFERVLFDEYALGGWRPASATRLAFAPRLVWLSLHVLALLLVLGWRSAWSGPFTRDPEPWLAASPLARARGFAGLLARAGRFDLLARLLRQGLLERWEARAGRRGETRVLAERLATLARGDLQRGARLTELFVTRAPRDGAELEALERDLAALEGELFGAAEAKKAQRTLGAGPSRSGS